MTSMFRKFVFTAAFLLLCGFGFFCSTQNAPAQTPSGPVIVKVTKANFEAEVNQSKLPVLVFIAGKDQRSADFRKMLEASAKTFDGKLKFVELDASEFAPSAPAETLPLMAIFDPQKKAGTETLSVDELPTQQELDDFITLVLGLIKDSK